MERAITAYACRHDRDGEIDLDTIAETPDKAKDKMVREAMGWRYDYPDRYSREEAWVGLSQFGRIVRIKIEIPKGKSK